ncbi:MAG: hypothetical protein QOC70_864 [Verrucomicrobiota bacterium]|jgi:hypothetical protein
MSIRGFQRALADLVSSPDLCRETLDTPASLGTRYDLTELEQRRLLYCAGHRGMKVCWGLHRANRLGPIHANFRLTCVALGSHLRDELEAFWRDSLPRDLQFQSESDRFAAFLFRRVRDRELNLPIIEDVMRFELAISSLRFQSRRQVSGTLAQAAVETNFVMTLHPFLRLIQFSHEPERLLEALTQKQPVPSDLARGEFFVLADAKKEGAPAIRIVDNRLGNILNSFQLGFPPPLSAAEMNSLLDAGLIARWPQEAPMARSAMQLV